MKKNKIKTAVIVDPFGSGFGEVTPEMEVKRHIKVYKETLGCSLKHYVVNNCEEIQPGTKLLLFDYGGVGLGNSLGEWAAKSLVRFAQNNPETLCIIVSSFTWSHYVQWAINELLDLNDYNWDEKPYEQIPNLIPAPRKFSYEENLNELKRYTPFWFATNVDNATAGPEILRTEAQILEVPEECKIKPAK